jgi:putative Mn2+ efflux pump MntP
MANRTKLRIAPLCAIGTLILALCLGIGFLYVGWHPGAPLTATGYIAMALGLVAAIVLGIGLAMLVHDKHR